MGVQARYGYDGDVLVNTNVVMEIDTWSLTKERDELDVTDFSSGEYEEVKGGIKRASGTIEGNWYFGDTNGQKALNDAFENGTKVTLKLQDQAGSVIKGHARIFGVDKGVAKKDKIRVTFNFKFTEAWTESYI